VSHDTWSRRITGGKKEHYNSIKVNHSLCRNKISVYGDKNWQSAFRIIPLESIVGYYSKYRRINGNIGA